MFNFLKKQNEQNEQNEQNMGTNEKPILSVMEKTDWTYDEAKQKMEEAKANTGISYRDYDKYDFHVVSVEEQVEAYKAVREKKEKRKIQKRKDIEEIMGKTGWSREKTIENVEDAAKRFGVTYRDYTKYKLYRYAVEVQEEEYLEQKEKSGVSKEELEKRKTKAIVEVMLKTGWSYEKTVDKIQEASNRTGCAYKEYVMYKFWELDEETQNALFLIKDSMKVAAKWDTNKMVYRMLTNKELTNEHFNEYLKRPWCVNTKISEQEFVEKFKDSERIIYKPLGGNRGVGVTAFDINEENAKDVYLELKEFPKGVVEQYVVQHHKLSELAPASVNTLRIVTISSNKRNVTEDGKHIDIAYASLRIGGGTSIIDNFHGGGMVAVADLKTGELVTDGADMAGNVYKTHPMTGITIKGFKIPFFQEAIDMVKEADEKNMVEGYLGWDIAITETGPVLIELNLKPGAVLLTTPYVAEKKGMKHIMEKYM